MDNTSKASVKILFNPNFGKVHINPDFLRPKAPESIHVNPFFLAKLETLPVVQKPHQSITSKYSKTNMTRTPRKATGNDVEATSNIESKSSSVLIKVGDRKLVRGPSVNNTGRPVVSECLNAKPRAKANIYKLDRRLSTSGKKQHISLPRRYAPEKCIGNQTLVANIGNFYRNPAIADNRKSYYTLNRQLKMKNKCLLNINGVLYKSTKTKLEKKSVASPVSSRNLKRKISNRHDEVNDTSNYLNLHAFDKTTSKYNSKSYLSSAKQKSIVFLSKHLTKSNVPCPIYRKVGKCAAYERGRCPKVHDKKHVAVCSKFLKGECTIDKCLLSHDVTLSKMPTCKFFLQGCCTRTSCPYLHKKLNDNAGFCDEFLRGYCNLGAACVQRHDFVNPDSSGRGKEEAPMSKIKNVERYSLSKETTADMRWTKNEFRENSHRNKKIELEKNCPRYFQDTLHKRQGSLKVNGDMRGPTDRNSFSDGSSYKNFTGKRPKLGDLPSFIPL